MKSIIDKMLDNEHYYWYIVAANGCVVAHSSVIYTRKWTATRAVLRFVHNIRSYNVELETENG
jgi:uncharacterized protein YegP (UPF0339 family)